MSPIKSMLLQKQQTAFSKATTTPEKLAIVAEISAILGADADSCLEDNENSNAPCPALLCLGKVNKTLSFWETKCL